MSFDRHELAVSVKNISKRFEMYERPHHRLFQLFAGEKRKFYKEFWALENVSFDVFRGECVGIIGRNGAGKSTLLQIIAGTLQPTSGTVEIHGKVAALLELGSGFNPEFTGRDNVFMNAAILGIPRERISSKFQEIADFADIGDFIERPVKTYSSGMLVRLAFAVQAMCEPDILIIDEALAVGDVFFQQKCLRSIKQLVLKGTTILFVSHSMATVQSFCSRCLYLKRGCPQQIGSATEMCDKYLNDTTEPVSGITSADGIGDENLFRTISVPGLPKESRFREDPGFIKRSSEHSGSEEAVFTALDFFDNSGKKISSCRPNERITAVASISVRKEIPQGASAGLLCRNRDNVDCFGLNTHSYGICLPPLKAGRHYTIEWSFSMPLLPSTYIFSIGLKPEALTNSFFHRVFSVAVLDVLYPPGGKVNTGLVSVPACKIVINEA